jgi:hypothetical protein
MPRDIDVVGVWPGTPYQVASMSSTANGVIVACGPAGTYTTHPKTGHRHTKDPTPRTSTWHERRVLSDVTIAALAGHRVLGRQAARVAKTACRASVA